MMVQTDSVLKCIIFPGRHCETFFDECELKPCADGATCVIGVSGATCVCVEGYTGTLCHETINYCTSNPCLNGGNYKFWYKHSFMLNYMWDLFKNL